jgi:hypothetical protein
MAMTFATIALPGYTHRNKHLEEGFHNIDRFLDPRLSYKSLLPTGGCVREIIPNQLGTLEFPRAFVK